jgi:hypothetical protein
MTKVEAAWVGAAIDAEGNVNWHTTARGTRRFGFELVNTSVEFISALIRATGIGTVYGKPPATPKHHFAFSWRVHRKADALDLAKQISAFSEKAQRLLILAHAHK